jgi:hypothetical protein
MNESVRKEETTNINSQTKSKEVQGSKDLDAIKRFFTDPDIFLSEKRDIDKYLELENIIGELTPEQAKKKKNISERLAIQYGLENGLWTASLSRSKYSGSLAQIRRSIKKDYDCQTSLELILADRIVAHYWRARRDDTILNQILEKEDGGYAITQQAINLIKELHRGVELADRQLNADIMLLKQLKCPQMNIKVNTENAFISQNQQFNVNNKNNEAK